jgi:hypothetical protein
MGTVPPLLTFLLMVISGWVHRHQLIVIELLQAENLVLKKRLRGKRIRFMDAERGLLARKAKAVGRKQPGTRRPGSSVSAARWNAELLQRVAA